MQKMLELIAGEEHIRLTEFLVGAIKRLAAGGAQFAALAANAPHIAFDEIERWSPIPLISIVEVTCQAAKARGLKRLGIFGAKFTMQGSFYPDVFAKEGIAIVVPNAEEQEVINQKYFGELVKGILLPETRDQLLAIAAEVRARENIDGLILGGTELPLILGDLPDQGIPFLDTTRIHVNAIVARILS
jgi:aspartate racemase